MGGNGIQLISVEEPDISSTCYRITANVWKSPQKEYIEKSIEKTGYTEVKLKEEWNSNGIDAVEGIYETIGANQSAKYTVAIKKMNNIEYNIIYLNGALTEYKDIWSAGDLKAKIFKTATPNIYKVDWYMADKSKNSNIYITFEKGLMKIIWSDTKSEQSYLKLYPATQESIKEENKGSSIEWKGNGSGFFIDAKGYIATNYHVIKDAQDIEIDFIRNGKKESYKAKVIQSDKQNDLSILQIDNDSFIEFSYLPYNFSTTISDVGTNIFALGYPMASIMGSEIKFTDGKISAKTGVQGDISCYQISVPIQPGNSGGALFDYDGNLIGITSSALNREMFNSENVNYAIKVSYLKNLKDVS